MTATSAWLRIVRLLLSVAAVAVIAGPTLVLAAYPDKPVRIIVPYAPGGAVDVVARKVAQKLSEQTGQSFFVENKPGASGTIGAVAVIRAAPDGYTLLALDNTFSLLPFVFKKLPWEGDLPTMPIAVSAYTPVMLLVNSDSKFKDLGSLIAFAKANPDKLTYGTGGNGSAPHFSTEAFQQAAGVKLTHVPYKGAAEAVQGLLGNSIDLVLLSSGSVASHLQGGKMRALAASGSKRLSSFPNIPTFAEAGLPGFGIVNWSGLAAPPGTPKEIITRLNAEVKKAMEAPDMKAFLAGLSADPGGSEPEVFAKLIKEENARWAAVAKKANIEKQ
jgi:tripartite-type tricarboxylate transporter receptor subunit TctC